MGTLERIVSLFTQLGDNISYTAVLFTQLGDNISYTAVEAVGGILVGEDVAFKFMVDERGNTGVLSLFQQKTLYFIRRSECESRDLFVLILNLKIIYL